MKAKEKQLLEYLKKHCPGRENAISGKQMKKRFRIHEAELRKLVHNLRVDGAPICSDRTGYFYPANAWEVIATIGHLRRMRDGVEKAIRSLERARKSQAFIAHKFSPFILSNFNMTIWPPSIPLVGSLRFPLLCSSCPLQFPPFSHVSHTAYADSPISRKQARKATSLLIYPSIFRG